MEQLFYHPEVHTRFGEQLFYILLSIRPFHSDKVREQLDKFTKEENITSHCYYELFGDSDVLIRAWFPPTIKPAEISEKITKFVGGVFQILPFEVHEIPGYWALNGNSGMMSPKVLQLITPQNVEKIQNKNKDSIEIIKEWKSNHLLFRINQTENIKVFIFIRYLVALRNTEKERIDELIFDTISQSEKKNQGENFSIYKGTGFAQMLIKAEVKKTKFFNINNLVMELSELVAKYDAFTTTYICTSKDYVEKDLISRISLRHSRGRDLAVAAIIPELYSPDPDMQIYITEELTQEITNWIHNNLLIKKLDSNEWDIIHSALIAIIYQNEDDFFDALLKPLRKIERFFYNHRERFIQAKIGKKEIPNLYRELGIERGKDKRKLTLGVSLAIYCKAIKMNIQYDIEKQLPESWDPIVKVRNDVAHGTINPFYNGEWQNMLCDYLKYSKKIEVLKKVIQKVLETQESDRKA